MARRKDYGLCVAQTVLLDESVKCTWCQQVMKIVDDAVGSAWTKIASNKQNPDIRGECRYTIRFSGMGDYIRRHYTPGHLRDKLATYHNYKTKTYYFTAIVYGKEIEYCLVIEASLYDANCPRDKLSRRMIVDAMNQLFDNLFMTRSQALTNFASVRSRVS